MNGIMSLLESPGTGSYLYSLQNNSPAKGCMDFAFMSDDSKLYLHISRIRTAENT